jgi:glutathione S-transferase
MALDFYHGHGSPFSWRVWLALEAKGIPYNLTVLSFQNEDTKKPEFKAINPRGLVPTVVDDGFAMWESLAILEYLDDRFTGGARLYPGDAASRGRVRRIIAEIESYLYREGISPIVDELFWSGDKGANPEVVAKARDKVKDELEYMAKELKGKFLAGDSISAADCVLAPCIQYCKRISFRKPESKLDELIPAALRDYNQRIESLPFFDKTYPPHWR